MSLILQPQLHQHYHTNTITSVQSNNNNNNNNNNKIEIRVCTNRTCRRQGSMTTFETLLGIAPCNVLVSACGCLGRCGAGPNIVVLPQAALVSHCGTPARAAEVMSYVCGDDHEGEGEAGVKRSLDALALRKRAEVEFENGCLSLAEALFSQAIEAKPIEGIHIAYKGRLASGNFAGALEDANEALMLAPQYAQAYISQGDAFLAMEQLEAAEKSYTMALQSQVQLLQAKMSSGATA